MLYTPSQIAQEIAALADVFEAMLPALQKLIPTNVLSQINTVVADLKVAAQAFATADGTTALSLAARIQNDVQAVLSALGTCALPGSIVRDLQIIQMWLPMLMGVVSLLFQQIGVH